MNTADPRHPDYLDCPECFGKGITDDHEICDCPIGEERRDVLAGLDAAGVCIEGLQIELIR
jgi:hypothetical protein